MKNIAIVFVKLGQYADAVTSYEHIVSEKPEIESCFNLLLCHYTVGDRDKIRKTFQRLVQINSGVDDEEKYSPVTVSELFDFLESAFPQLFHKHEIPLTVPFSVNFDQQITPQSCLVF